MAPDKALALMSWSRRAEISCDRAGLVCSRSLQDATTALIKLTCGLGAPLVSFHLDDYLAQMRDIQSLGGSVKDDPDWFSSHPFNPLRVAALYDFSSSQLYAGEGAKLGAADLEARIEGLLKAMEPGRAEARPEAQEALLWGGYWIALPAADRHALLQKLVVVARADGKLADEEVRALHEAAGALGTSPGFVDQVVKLFE